MYSLKASLRLQQGLGLLFMTLFPRPSPLVPESCEKFRLSKISALAPGHGSVAAMAGAGMARRDSWRSSAGQQQWQLEGAAWAPHRHSTTVRSLERKSAE